MRNRPQISSEQRYAWKVQDILVGCGLSQPGASPVGGQLFHIPLVIKIEGRPPNQLTIQILPGQSPKHYEAHAETIAYNLGVDEVHVFPLGPYEILLKLVRNGQNQPVGSSDTTPIVTRPANGNEITMD
ncbi:MAG: hypothetical protein ACRDQY_05545 [Pseudonocardiaceae bacterium]